MAAGLERLDGKPESQPGADRPENLHVLWIENAVLHFKKAPPDASANATLTLTNRPSSSR